MFFNFKMELIHDTYNNYDKTLYTCTVCVLHMMMYVCMYVYICRYIYPTSSGVMCLDIHPAHPHLLAIGLYDGSVCVYDLRQDGTDPVFRSTAKTGKHTDPVWQVYT